MIKPRAKIAKTGYGLIITEYMQLTTFLMSIVGQVLSEMDVKDCEIECYNKGSGSRRNF
jgi:hypothetical protein